MTRKSATYSPAFFAFRSCSESGGGASVSPIENRHWIAPSSRKCNCLAGWVCRMEYREGFTQIQNRLLATRNSAIHPDSLPALGRPAPEHERTLSVPLAQERGGNFCEGKTHATGTYRFWHPSRLLSGIRPDFFRLLYLQAGPERHLTLRRSGYYSPLKQAPLRKYSGVARTKTDRSGQSNCAPDRSSILDRRLFKQGPSIRRDGQAARIASQVLASLVRTRGAAMRSSIPGSAATGYVRPLYREGHIQLLPRWRCIQAQ